MIANALRKKHALHQTVKHKQLLAFFLVCYSKQITPVSKTLLHLICFFIILILLWDISAEKDFSGFFHVIFVCLVQTRISQLFPGILRWSYFPTACLIWAGYTHYNLPLTKIHVKIKTCDEYKKWELIRKWEPLWEETQDFVSSAC